MPPEQSATPTVTQPVTDLTDPRAITLLTTEHWSLLTARSLAYNEAFTRGGMFLTFLSMSFVALALFSSAMSFGSDFLTVAAVLLAFDVVLGLATYGRIAGANVDDLRALHGMARIRHSYTQIAPVVEPYFTTATHDDIDSVLTAYGTLPSSGIGDGRVRAHDVGRDDRAHHVDGRRRVRGGARTPLRRPRWVDGLDRPRSRRARVRRAGRIHDRSRHPVPGDLSSRFPAPQAEEPATHR